MTCKINIEFTSLFGIYQGFFLNGAYTVTSKTEFLCRAQVLKTEGSMMKGPSSKQSLKDLTSSRVAREALEQESSSSDEEGKRALKRCNAMPYPFPVLRQRVKPSLSPTRTIVSRENCSNLFPELIDQSEGRVTLLSQSYKMLETGSVNFSEERYVSIGACPQHAQRELLLFDQRASSQAKERFNQLDALFSNALPLSSYRTISIVRVLHWTMENIKEALTSKSTERATALIASWEGEHLKLLSGVSIPLIPIDFFIQHKTGVCRHRAILFAYLFSSLLKKYPDSFSPDADVLYYRATLSKAGHAWVCVKDGRGGIYSVDPTLAKIIAIEKGMFSNDRNPLSLAYGKGIAFDFVQRLAPELLEESSKSDGDA